MGGLNKSGVDCSGFVYITYREVFGMTLPRSTRGLSNIGSGVSLSQVAPGDLVFFKTGTKQKHVGIYLGKGDFVHASTSKGVIISNIHTPYWTDAYRESRRVARF
ncbi:NlpC/P60 family protein [Hahella sp. CCB-MM4]|uniref:NlpC/P60 family protein n=1 Tax=Hahella sp. (strain CCB-MM4) TaxID=1926491 RepID=UPI001FEE6EA9|nr:NlpC/P60 family protein [Hahella sp. CCB-MM4]